MDGVQAFLDDLRRHGLAVGNFLGLIHLLIGRRISQADGTLVSPGMTWRELATLFKRMRWDKDSVRELGLDPADLPPRDRQRFWYMAVAQAKVDSPTAIAAGDRLAEQLQPLGYSVSPPPRQSS